MSGKGVSTERGPNMSRLIKQSIFAVVLVLILGILIIWWQERNKVPPAVRSILEEAEHVELISIDPNSLGKLKDGYYGWKVIGKLEIKNAETRQSVIAAVERAISQGAPRAMCFVPRHAIHASTNDGRTIDLLICFVCNRVEVYVNNERQGPDLPTSGSSEPILDKVLTNANVPLGPEYNPFPK
jgi:hypothetical protein